MDPTYPLFPIFALFGFFLVLVPLPWHLHALNSGTCLFMIWTATACLIQFVNSIVWHGSVVDKAPLWCDISTRLTVGVSVAIPAASLCINRRLYKIANCQAATITHAQKNRAVLIDLAIGLGIPTLQMALQFIVQGHRYDIWEDIGCLPTTVNTPAAYPLSYLWPNVISLISAIYCTLTLRAFLQRRAQFAQFLSSSNTSLTVNRYFRLMCLATTEILLTIPISSYGVYLNATATPIYPWKSWSDIHFDWYTLNIYPAVIWRSSRIASVILELNRWLLVFCALVFFAFFGFADEAIKNYKRACSTVMGIFKLETPFSKGSSDHKNIILPLKNSLGTSPASRQPKSDTTSTCRYSFHSSASTDYTETLPVSPVAPKMEPDCLAGSSNPVIAGVKFDKLDSNTKFTELPRHSRMTI